MHIIDVRQGRHIHSPEIEQFEEKIKEHIGVDPYDFPAISFFKGFEPSTGSSDSDKVDMPEIGFNF